MGIIQTWNEVLESIGTAAGAVYIRSRWFKELNEPIVGLTCALWGKYPKGIPFFPYSKGFLDSVCAQAGFPIAVAPSAGFEGGQCIDVLYNIQVFVDRTFVGNTTNVEYGLVGYGNIDSIKLEFQPPESPQQLAVVARGQSGALIPTGVDLDNVGGVGVSGTITSINVVRADGLADTCGNPPGGNFPPNPPRDPADFKVTKIVNIYNNNGDVIGDTSIDISVDESSDLSIPLTVNVGGINVDIDIDGIRTPDPVQVPPEGIKTRRVPLPGSDELEEEIAEEENADEKEFEDVLIWVTLTITKKPDNAKTQWGAGAPDVFYCGWFEFQVEGSNLTRTPVHWDNNIFLAPDRATGYAYTLYDGFEGRAKAYTEKVEVIPEPPPTP